MKSSSHFDLKRLSCKWVKEIKFRQERNESDLSHCGGERSAPDYWALTQRFCEMTCSLRAVPAGRTHIKTSTSLNGSNWPPTDSLKQAKTWELNEETETRPSPCRTRPVLCLTSSLPFESWIILLSPRSASANSVTVGNDKTDSPGEQEGSLCPGQSSQLPTFYLSLSLCS